MICGLLGRTLGHSYSPQIHSHLGNYTYNLFEKEPEQLEDFLLHGEFDGINVTIPYKKDVLPYCDELTPIARKLGSVNTIIRRKDGTLLGHNSDYFGFSFMVERTGLTVTGKKVLVLGTGGAAVTVCAVLNALRAHVVQISRSGQNHYGNLDLHKDAAVIVNATPVGMYPKNDNAPLDLCAFPHLEGVLDLIYNPARTRLLQQAESLGLKAENGLWMLVAQAYESARLFTEKDLPAELIKRIYNQLSSDMKNIILIGMPGCGKSTIGALLSGSTGKAFIDSDTEIEKEAGITVAEYFAQYGEASFRALESKVLSRICKESSCIIATGGGCVTRPENYIPLHQNATVIWINRCLSFLPTNGRPLSQKTSAEEMFRIRKPMYERFADMCVNNTTPEETADKILSLIHGGA